MSLTTWTLNEDSRWQISFDMETETPLHIGSGEFIRHDEIKNTSNEDQKFVDITACIKGKNNLPIIPGSTIKGQLYEWLKARGVENQLLENIFGKGHNPENKDQGKGGKAEFHDAYLTKLNTTSDEKTAPKDWPYWQEKTQTFIEASTAIDRHRQTALDQSLHYTETVPPGIGFRFTITGVMGEQEVALLIAAVDSFDKNQPCFGAADANGYGKMKFRENIKVKKMGTTEITHWLEEFTKNDSNDMVFDTIKYLEPKEIYLLLEQGKPLLKPIKNPTEIELTLTFSGPFLINDPSRVKALHTDTQKNTDHFPLLDKEGFPRLPSSSIRGVLRSQAERIFRTVGVKCCDTKTPCNTMYYKDDISELCPVCQIFGGSGWKSIIKIHDFVCTKTNGKKKQDFVAIDRFHGGGKDGAKFNATYYERPEFKGKITLTPRLNNNDLAWGKGLLTLILRDLKEGDMSFGFGRNKGYGDVESVNIDKSTLLFESDLQAFYTKINESNLNSRFCNSPKISTEVVEKIPLTAVNTASNGSFHNPYHFIPVKKPDTAYWTPHIELKKTNDPSEPICSSVHSHGFYRDQTQDKAKIYNGRIVCRLQTETPIFIGAGKAAQDNQGINQAQPIDNYRLNERIAIPATSLRGVISSMAEAASNSALRVLDDGMLSYRQKIGKTPTALGMIIKKEGQWRLIPLTLPTLKERNGDYALPKEYSTMFPDGKAKLKVYLENAFTNSTEKTTWTQKNSKVYYIELDDKHKMDAEKLVAPNSDYLRKPSDKPKFVIGQRAINPEVYERPNPKSTPGILRILGHKTNRTDIPSTKKHEIFIPIPDGYENNGQLNYNEFIDKEPSFLIPNEVVSRFEELANQRTDSQNDILSFENWLPYHPKGMQRNTDHTLSLHEGDLVYFSPNINQNDIVAEIAFSSIWRGRVEEPQGVAANVQRFFPRELWPFNKDRTHISPAELLFGFTEINADGDKNENDNLAFAGKVRVSAGLGLFAENKIDTELLDEEITLKALSSPKLPSPALYFRSKSSTNKYISKETLNPEQHEANGRKYYLHALRKQNDPDLVQQLNSNGTTTDGTIKLPWETQPNPENDRLQLKVKIKPIKSGQAFYLHLDFNNLTEWELGLLCYTLRPTESFRHRIGMGKPIGLGSVKIDVVALLTIDRKQRYTKDPLESYRYNQHNWVNQAYLKEMNDMGYKITETSNPLQPTDLRKKFTDTMSYDIYRALDLLGNPHNIKHPVHYPQVENQNIEEENFKWFVTNDNPNAETNTLEAINEKSECIPTLKRHRIKK